MLCLVFSLKILIVGSILRAVITPAALRRLRFLPVFLPQALSDGMEGISEKQFQKPNFKILNWIDFWTLTGPF